MSDAPDEKLHWAPTDDVAPVEPEPGWAIGVTDILKVLGVVAIFIVLAVMAAYALKPH